MEGLERSSELSRVGTAVEHSRSCIWSRYSEFKLGLLQPALRAWSRAKRIVLDSSVPLQPLTVSTQNRPSCWLLARSER
jgi:hypothetical protein